MRRWLPSASSVWPVFLAADPGTLETEKAFKKRVKNAVAWLNGSKAESQGFYNSISSMPKRLAEAKQLKGARTSY